VAPGELFPKVGFIVTNLPMDPDWVVRFYNQRGTAEQQIKEGNYAFHWTRLSCKRFRDNEVRLQLHALAYNLATFLRRIELPEAMAGLVADQPATQTDQDRRPRRAPRPRHHLPTGRGGGNGSDGAGHPCRHPPNTSATAMRMIAIPTQTERKSQDRSVRHAEERRCRAKAAAVQEAAILPSGV
jgi:hypothetical protein